MGENLENTSTLENTEEMSEREKFALSRIENSPLRINKSPSDLSDLILNDEIKLDASS